MHSIAQFENQAIKAELLILCTLIASLDKLYLQCKVNSVIAMNSDGLTKRGARCKKSKEGHYLMLQDKAIFKKTSLS